MKIVLLDLYLQQKEQYNTLQTQQNEGEENSVCKNGQISKLFTYRVVKYPDFLLPGSTGIKSLLPGSGYSIPVPSLKYETFCP